MTREEYGIEELEQQLMQAAGALQYPRTPDLVSSQRATTAPSSRARLAWIAAAVAVTVVTVVAVPPVRAAVFEILGIGSVQISLGPTAMSPAEDQITLAELPGETSLSVASDTSSMPILVPSYPSDLGSPDRVFLLEEVGGTVVLVWEQADSADLARLALYIIPPSELVNKLAPETIEQAAVSGQPALWTTGDHFLELVTNDPQKRVLVTGNVLIWTENGVTYRLETDLPLNEAIRIAESLR